MSELQLFNTLGRKLEDFTPLSGKKVGMYSCGLTVYNYAHLGNLRSYLFADILKRVLMMNGFKVKHVMNITDVGHLTDDADAGDDKVETAAAAQKKSAWDITKFYTDVFLQDLAALKVLPADQTPKATEHIPEQIALIRTLEEKGFTYRTSDGVYFDTAKFPEYGKLSGGTQGNKEGARVEKNKEKRHAADFALWKFSKPEEQRQMEWESPWGTGFPGWHIECSAMSMKYLGESFDIHSGGVDHIAIHHTNEIAQSEAATGKPFVRYWLHHEFLLTGEEKMAKSANNFLRLATVVEKNIDPLAYRYFVLNTHYRKPLTFSWEALTAAEKALNALRGRIRMWPKAKGSLDDYEQRFRDAVNDDLNFPKALGVLWEMMKADVDDAAKHAAVQRFDAVLGLGLAEVKALKIPKDVRQLVEDREAARASKDFTKADELRDAILQAGFTVDDTEAGSVIKAR